MDITTLLLATQVEVREQLLDVQGGGLAWWSVSSLPSLVDIAVGFVLHAEPKEHRESLSFRLWIADGDRHPLEDSSREMLAHWMLPQRLVPGQPLAVPVATRLTFTAQHIGRYFAVLDVDGIEQQRATPFAIVRASMSAAT